MEIRSLNKSIALFKVDAGKGINWNGDYYLVTDQKESNDITVVNIFNGHLRQLPWDTMVLIGPMEFRVPEDNYYLKEFQKNPV